MKVVDKIMPDRINYAVHEDYAVMLNQTNIGQNNNKFYVLQLLKSKSNDDTYGVWTRYGRVGENGKGNLKTFDKEKSATTEFEKIFKSKTGNRWADIESFESKDKKYTIVETEETEESNNTNDDTPMGKLSEAQIKKGQLVLEEIEELMNEHDDNSDSDSDDEYGATLAKLSSKFFTLIPTMTVKRQRLTPITTMHVLKEKEELLKFYLRMGFEEVEKDNESNVSPISGIMELPLPKTLSDAIGKLCSTANVNSSVKNGEELAKKNAGKPIKKMDKEMYGSIMLYTSNAIYAELNKFLRDENRKGIKKYFNYLRLFFEATNRLPKKKVTLWRGISVDLSSQYQVNKTVTWWGVSSCTSEKNVAQGFMNNCGGKCTLFTIDTETSVDISALSFYSTEKESLLMPGTQLLVKSISKTGLITNIHLEEIGREIS